MQLSDVDFRDIQGLARFAYGPLPEACLLLAEIADADAARAWLDAAAAKVTRAVSEPRLTQALQIAFTYQGLQKLGLPDAALEEFSAEFKAGMVEPSRSRRLGDIKANDPANWRWGVAGTLQPHVLIMLYAEKGGLAPWEAEVKGNLWGAAFGEVYCLSTIRLDDLEPFGFVDGVSQPRLDWERAKPTRLRDTVAYTNVSALGEFLLGYPNEYGRYTDRPLLDPADDPAGHLPLAEDAPGKRDLGRNGTYLVLRDLAQDVPLFHEFVNRTESDAAKGRVLEAAMAGRMPADIPIYPKWTKSIPDDDPGHVIPPGAPVTPLSHQAIDGVGPKLKDVWLDQFTFKDDPDGTTCPYGAHIRRANPRNADLPEATRGWIGWLIRTLGFGRKHSHDDMLASTRFHRLLRRGRDYKEEGGERGLRFICLNANISRQFEFIQTSWLMNPKFNGLNEDDPLVGNHATPFAGGTTDTFTRPQESGLSCRANGVQQFVTVQGGAYFFMPGLSALRYIARGKGEGTAT